MDWTQFLLLFIAVAGMIYSIKSDAREDRKRSAEDRRDILDIMKSSDKKFDEMAKETRQFHGRLCTLEEKYIHMMERFMERKL